MEAQEIKISKPLDPSIFKIDTIFRDGTFSPADRVDTLAFEARISALGWRLFKTIEQEDRNICLWRLSDE